MKERLLKGHLLSKFIKKIIQNAIKNCPFFIGLAEYGIMVFLYGTGNPVFIKKKAFSNPCSIKNTLLVVWIFILIGSGTGYGKSQPHQITGTVISASDGKPLEGATVKLKSGRVGLLTGKDGSFTLTTPITKGTLIVTFVGYQTQEVDFSPDSKLPIIIKLAGEGNELEEVEVNTGYQQIPKERATGSFVHIDSALFNRAVSTDVISRLKGIAPSLLFDERTGGAPKLSIRGRSTIFANADPLIVVDNFPYEGDLSNLNPNDVADVSILRDAAAASIWGVRAGNGVIVITTKKGRKNQPLKLSFNLNNTVTKRPDLFYEPRILSAEFIDNERYLFKQGYYTNDITNTTTYPVLTPLVEYLAFSGNGLDAAATQQQVETFKQQDVRNDLKTYFYQPQYNQQYVGSASGGTERHTFYFAAGYERNKGSLVGDAYNRVNLSTQQQFSPIRNLQLGAALFYTGSETSSSPAIQEFNMGTKQIYPYARLADENGAALAVAKQFSPRFTDLTAQKQYLDWQYRPLDEIDASQARAKINSIRLTSSVRYQLTTNFSAQVQYQYEHQGNQNANLQGANAYDTRDLINRLSTYNSSTAKITRVIQPGAILSLTDGRLSSHNGRFQLNYDLQKGQHQLTALAGGEVRQNDVAGYGHAYYGYDPLTGASKPVSFTQAYQQYPSGQYIVIPSYNNISGTLDRFRSYFANAAYTYLGRYTLSASGRIDQSNLFGVRSNQRSVPLWSVGAKWDLYKEGFFQLPAFSRISLRGTYGYNGNLDNRVTALTTASYITAPVTSVRAASIISPPNPELRWERTAMLNLGMDFATAGGAVSGSIDYYSKRGCDLIGKASLDPTLGFTSYTGNVANMVGSGVDVQLNTSLATGMLSWQGQLLFSYTTDRVTAYPLPATVSDYLADGSLTGNSFAYTPTVGKPLFGIYTYRWAGLDPQTGAPLGILNGQPSKDYGTMLSTATFDDLEFHGRATPDMYGAFRNTFKWQAFSFSFNISYKFGYSFRRNSINYTSLFQSNIGHADFAKRWQQPGDEHHTSVPSRIYPADGSRDLFYNNSSVLVEPGDHIRLEDLQVTYTFRKVKVYAYASNLGILWRANDQGLDPDFTLSRDTPRLEKVYPLPFSLAFGITMNF